MIALRAMFGQDEASYGAFRYRVDHDGIVLVPREAALPLVRTGGFAAVVPENAPGSADIEIFGEGGRWPMAI